MTLAGTTVYVITNPRDVNDVYNNKGSLTYESFLGDIMSSFGTSASGVKKILQREPLVPSNGNPTTRLKASARLRTTCKFVRPKARISEYLASIMENLYSRAYPSKP